MSVTKMRYLVTGGAGFIGSRLVDRILGDAGNEAAVVDDLSVGLPAPAPRDRLTFFQIDIRDADRLIAAFEAFRPQIVIHLAAIHHIPTCELKRAYSLDVNVIGTETVLDAAEKTGVERFLLASSGAVYDWHDGALSEAETPLRSADNYSVAKHSNEVQVRLWAERTGKKAAIARIFNTIGHGDPNAHLIPDIITQIPVLAEKAEIALGNLLPKRDYIHVEDTARALYLIANAPETASPASPIDIFNVASGKDVSVGELVELLGSVLGVSIAVSEDPGRKRRVDRPSQLANTAKIKELLGFETKRSLKEALVDIAEHAGWRREAVK